MHTASWIGMLFTVLGGLALFIVGMTLMTNGLRAAAGPTLRHLLKLATRGRLQGAALGTILGFLVHSTATTVMLVGFIHAGLISLAAAVPPIIGANVGTTLAMQVISFKLGDFWYATLIPGAAMLVGAQRTELKELGKVGIGFGLLLLGMNTMGAAIIPYRQHLAPILASIDGSTLPGMFLGIGASLLVTVIVQSSGATIGMIFALITGGALTGIEQVLPLILGAHIGTCSTALLAGIGTSLDARRAAFTHLLFNIVGVALAVALSGPLLALLPRTSDSLLRQAANAHTLTMLLAAVAVLPVSALFARAVSALIRSHKPQPEASHLDEALLPTPEKALVATIRELQRVARLAARSFHLNAELIFELDRAKVSAIRRDEETIDEIQRSMKEYLAALTSRYLSRRQALMVQHINRCMIDIERMEDHNTNLCELSVSRHRNHRARFTHETLESLVRLYKAAERVLQLVIDSLNADNTEFQAQAQAILEARDAYVDLSMTAKAVFQEKIAAHEFPPIVGIYLGEYTASFDRIVRHAKMIALVESQPHFWIKRQKLDKQVPEANHDNTLPKENAKDFLDELQREGFV